MNVRKNNFLHWMFIHPEMNRLVRTRMPGGVGTGGENPLATRLCPPRDFLRYIGEDLRDNFIGDGEGLKILTLALLELLPSDLEN